MDSTSTARIAVLGWQLESNSLAPPSDESEFAARRLLWGEELWTDADLAMRFGERASLAFGARMSRLRNWRALPIGFCDGGAGGPCEQATFERLSTEMLGRLRAALPLDGVFICGHGAGTTSAHDDMDGPLYAAIRALVGPDVPIVAVLDLHANVSAAMFESTDALIGYRTNPHVDMDERYAEAADVLDGLLRGRSLSRCWIRVPLLTPQVAQLTAEDQPMGELFARARALSADGIVNVSLFPGFALGDTPHNGLSVLVTAHDAAAAERTCRSLASSAWSLRERFFRRELLDVPAGVAIAAAAASRTGAGPVILADVADNPGGGGRGNTLWLLSACIDAGVRDVLVGAIYDPVVVEAAFAAGEGASIRARFNTRETSPYSRRAEWDATVVRLSAGRFRGRHGMSANCEVNLGRSCALRIGGVDVVVVSVRRQLLAADWFEHFGLDVRGACAIVVKSRGHFRAGFAHVVPPERIYEVDAPGLTTPNLAQVEWRRVARPIYPLDPAIVWEPQHTLRRSSQPVAS